MASQSFRQGPIRITELHGPWLHTDFQAGSLDVNDSAAKLAQFLALDQPSILQNFARFFSECQAFNATLHARTKKDGPKPFKPSYRLLGFPGSSAPDDKIKYIEESTKRWAVLNFLPVGLADLFAFLGDPSTAVTEIKATEPPKQAVEATTRLSIMSDWWELAKDARMSWSHSPADYTGSLYDGPTKQSIATLFLQSGRKGGSRRARLNVEAAVYIMKLYLMGDPELKGDTLRKRLELDAAADNMVWSEKELETASQIPELLKTVATTVILALALSPTALLSTRYTLLSKSSICAFRFWRSRGNGHHRDLHHPLTRLDRCLWKLLLHAALGVIEPKDIFSAFFSDPDVCNVLDKEPNPLEAAVLAIPGEMGIKLRTAAENYISRQTAPLPTYILENAVYYFEDDEVHHPKATPSAGADAMEVDDALKTPLPSSNIADGATETLLETPPTGELAGGKGRAVGNAAAQEETVAGDKEITDFENETPAEGATGQKQTPGGDKEMTDVENDTGAETAAGQRKRLARDRAMTAVKTAAGQKESFVGDKQITENDTPAGTAAGQKGICPEGTQTTDTQERPAKRQKRDVPPATTGRQSEMQQEPRPPPSKPRPKPPGPRAGKSSTGTSNAEPVDISWIAVSEDGRIPVTPQPQVLREAYAAVEKRLDPTVLYPLSTRSLEFQIWRWQAHPEGALTAEPERYSYRPFLSHDEELNYLIKVVESEPQMEVEIRPTADHPGQSRKVPLHVHPSAQFLHSSGQTRDPVSQLALLPDIVPDKTRSKIFVVHEDNWEAYTADQYQALFANRAALVVHREPFKYGGKTISFDNQGIESFTNLDRLAWIQNLGLSDPDHTDQNYVGTPRDLLKCAEIASAAPATSDGRKTQRLNLLANTLPGKSMPITAGWIALATHEVACHWLQEHHRLPVFRFPWDELKWSIFATRDTITWLHADVLFTQVTLATGEKIWFVGRRKSLPPGDHRGDMRSRHAFKDYNGWTDMTDVWDFERVLLTPYTTLYMPVGQHMVITKEDSIGVGQHGIPLGNVRDCVLITLHNVLLSSLTTNADHEPARRLIIRMFIFIALALVDYSSVHIADDRDEFQPRKSKGKKAAAQAEPVRESRPMTEQMLENIPDITTAAGVVDILTLRSFVVLFLALDASAYQFERGDQHALPVPPDVYQEIEFAWTLTGPLDRFMDTKYKFTRVQVETRDGDYQQTGAPNSFKEAADASVLLVRPPVLTMIQIALVTMAASMVRYQSEVHAEHEKLRLPAFTPTAFRRQVERMLHQFENHYEQVHDACSADPALLYPHVPLIDVPKGPVDTSSLVKTFRSLVDIRGEALPMLLPWDEISLPFLLSEVPCNHQR